MRHRPLAVLFVVLLFALPVAAQDHPATPAASGPGMFAGIVEDEREAAAAVAENLPRYEVNATLLPSGAAASVATPFATPAGQTLPAADLPRIEGSVAITYVNDTDAPVSEVYLRLYPNFRQYEAGRMEVRDIQVDGEPVRAEPPGLASVPDATPAAIGDPGSADLTVIRIPIDALEPADNVTISMAFTTVVPPPTEMGTNVFAMAPESGAWTLTHAFPMLAGWDAEHGWDIDPPAGWSEPVFSTAAIWDVRLTAPADLVIAAPGEVIEEIDAGNGMIERHSVAGPIREFVLVASPAFAMQVATIGDTTVTVFHQPGQESGATILLDWATGALDVYSTAFGAYPYTTLAVVSVPGMLGAEYPQVVMLGEQFVADPENSGSRPGAVEILLAHEIAHQWWYGIVGINPHHDAFLDEGLAEYSSVLYFEWRYGPEPARVQMDQGVLVRYLTWLVNDRDHVAHQASIAFPDAGVYYAMTYRKAALGFEALRQVAGDEPFLAAMHGIVTDHRFGIVSPSEVRDALAGTGGDQVRATWEMWFEQDTARVEIVMDAPAATPVATPVANEP